MPKSKITVQIVVLNGGKYIRHCLDSLLEQSYLHELTDINILDNGSTDGTIAIITDYELRIKAGGFAKFNFVESKLNFGMWGGHEELIKQTQNPYVVFLSADVILEKDFLARAVEVLENKNDVGAIQAKVYQFNIRDLEIENWRLKIGRTIDSCGFRIFRSRRIVNIGHGETDTGQYDKENEIFGVEGAVPVFKMKALESIRVLNEISDHDLFWYAEDLDVAWRLRLAGWKQIYSPTVIAWHDRQTTKKTGRSFRDFRAIRSQIPLHKRRLEWRNIRCSIIKNDYIINILKDLPYWLGRELKMIIYLMFYEPRVLAELPNLLRLLPRMLHKRREILGAAKVSASEIHRFFA